MTTTKQNPPAGVLRAARVLEDLSDMAHRGQRPQLIADEIAEIIGRESGLAEALKALEAIYEVLDQSQPGMPPLPYEWRQWLYAKTRIALTKASNPNADTKQVFEKGRWT